MQAIVASKAAPRATLSMMHSECEQQSAPSSAAPSTRSTAEEGWSKEMAVAHVLEHKIAFSKQRPAGLSLLDLLGQNESGRSRKKAAKHIMIDDQGRWGVNVAWNKRYFYASRDAARRGAERHLVGQCGRIG